MAGAILIKTIQGISSLATRSLIVKVDHLAKREHVSVCRQIGVNRIGVPIASLSELDRVTDLTGGDFTDVSFRIDLQTTSKKDALEICRRRHPRSIDFVGHFVPSKATCARLLSEGFELFFSNIEASYDDDPSWILGRYRDLFELDNTFFQIDINEDWDDAWSILRDGLSHKHDELSIDDIDTHSRRHNLVVNVNYTPWNIREVLQRLPTLSGIALSFETKGFRRSYSMEEIQEVIKAIPQDH